jgi:hypothetical protein
MEKPLESTILNHSIDPDNSKYKSVTWLKDLDKKEGNIRGICNYTGKLAFLDSYEHKNYTKLFYVSIIENICSQCQACLNTDCKYNIYTDEEVAKAYGVLDEDITDFKSYVHYFNNDLVYLDLEQFYKENFIYPKIISYLYTDEVEANVISDEVEVANTGLDISVVSVGGSL